jgi:hypothetical protein
MSAFDDYLNAPVATPTQQSFDAYLGTAPAQASAPAAASPAPQVAQSQPGVTAGDFAAGGASPDTLSQLLQIGQGAAHGIGSMFNNAANFAERHIPFFPASIAARDTAAQAQADQQFAQSASPGSQAAATVAPMLLPMSGAMAPGNALRAGVTSLPRMTGFMGRTLGSVAGNALNGGLMATGAPIDPSQAVGPQDATHVGFGTALGAGIPALLNGGVATGSWLGRNLAGIAAPVVNPRNYVGQGIANFLGDEAPNVASAIRTAPSYVPGYQPTVAQIAGNVGLVATEKAAANGDPAFKIALAQRGVNNNAVLWNALDQVAGNQNDLSNLIAARDTATNPLYNVAKQQNIPVDAPMTDLLSRPAMQKAISRAQTGSDNRNAGQIITTIGIPNPMGGAPSSLTTMNGNGAQRVKEAFDAMLMPENTNKLSGKEIGDIRDTRDAFMAWLEGHSPEFAQARQTYAAMSPPINSMQAAQQISERLGGLGRSMDVNQNPILTAPGYATAMSQAIGNQEFGIQPQAQAQLENIGRELQRATISNSLKSPGSDTAYNLAANGWLARNLYGPGFGGATPVGRGLAGLATALGGHPWLGVGVASGLGKVGQTVGNRLNAQVSDLLLNPSGLLPYLDARAAAPINPANPVFPGLLQRNVVPALIGGVARGGLMNSQ